MSTEDRWTPETEAVVYRAVSLGPEDLELAAARTELTRDVLTALLDAGLLRSCALETRSAHGTISRYVNQKCRCDACRASNSAYQRAYRVRAR